MRAISFICFVLGNGVFTVFTYQYFDLFFIKAKVQHRTEILCYALYFFATILLRLFIMDTKLYLLIALALLVFLALLYEERWKKKVFVVLLIYLVIHITHFALIFFSGHYDLLLFNAVRFNSIIGIILEGVPFYLLIVSVTFVRNFRQGTIILPLSWALKFLTPLIIVALLCISLVPTVARNLVHTELNFNFLFFISVLALTTINILAIFFHDFRRIWTELKLRSYQNKYYEHQLNVIETSEYAFKSLRHDLKNHLVVLSNLLKENDYDYAKEYLATIYSELDTPRALSKTGNISVDSLINYKLQNISALDVDLEYHAEIPPILNITTFDLTIILGNLLDNALESLLVLPPSTGKKLSINLKYERNRLAIKISNTYDGVILASRRTLLTRKPDPSIHGIGLKNARATIAKYYGDLKITHDQNCFTVYAIIYEPPLINS